MSRSLLITFLTICIHASYCLDDAINETIHITSPMNGWVLTKTPIALSFFSDDCSGNQHHENPTGSRGCQTIVLLDGKEVIRHDLVEGSFSGVLGIPMENGDHEVAVSVYSESDGSMVEAARARFVVMVDADPSDEKAVFASMYALDGAPTAETKKFGSVGEVKSAVILYHSNIKDVYPVQWVTKCIDTILHQTHKQFDIFELNYGDDEHSVFRWHLHKLDGRKYSFLSKKLQDHAMAMNYLLDLIFADGYDAVFNTNLDDFYAPTRFAKQLEAVVAGAQLVSSFFVRVSDADALGGDFIMVDTEPTYMCQQELLGGQEASAENVRGQLQEEHNVVCHPSVLFTKAFWHTLPALDCEGDAESEVEEAARRHARRHTQFQARKSCGGATEGERNVVRPLRYRKELPAEDLRLWQRAVLMGGVSVTVVPEVLVYYRIHSRQISPQAVDMNREWRDKMFASGDMLHRLRVGLLTICTGRYCEHLEQHLSDLSSNFLAGHALFHYVFTDQPELASAIIQGLSALHSFSASVAYIPGRGYPADTLYRYHYFLEREQELLHQTDVVFYLDVDLVIAQPVRATEVMPTPHRPLVAVRHPLQDGAGTPEHRPESTAYVPPTMRRPCYVAGGFVGGRTPEFVAMSKVIRDQIDADDRNEVVAIWHDESHLNCFLSLHPLFFRILPPAYLYPEGWDISFARKIVVQKIPHAETRFATQRFVAPCGRAANGVCELGEQGLGALLFQVAAAIAVKERVREDDRAWEAAEVALPLNWCFGKSGGLCAEGPRSSFRGSWLWGLRRCDSLGEMRMQAVSEESVEGLGGTESEGGEEGEEGEEGERERERERGRERELARLTPAPDKALLLLVGSFASPHFFHPRHAWSVVDALALPPRARAHVDHVYNGIRQLFPGPTTAVHIASQEHLAWFSYVVQLTKEKQLTRYWVLFCTPDVASDLCAPERGVLMTLSGLYVVGRYEEGEVLGLMARCDAHLVTDPLSFWGAYLSPHHGRDVVVSALLDEALGGFAGEDIALPHWTVLE